MMHDELLGIECHRITWATLSNRNVAQQLDGRWIEAEEMQPSSIWPTALDPVEKRSVTGLQQVTSGALTMAASDQRLTGQRSLRAVPRVAWGMVQPPAMSTGFHASVFGRWRSWPTRWRLWVRDRSWCRYLVGDPRTAVAKLSSRWFWPPWGYRRGSVMPGACQGRLGGSGGAVQMCRPVGHPKVSPHNRGRNASASAAGCSSSRSHAVTIAAAITSLDSVLPYLRTRVRRVCGSSSFAGRSPCSLI